MAMFFHSIRLPLLAHCVSTLFVVGHLTRTLFFNGGKSFPIAQFSDYMLAVTFFSLLNVIWWYSLTIFLTFCFSVWYIKRAPMLHQVTKVIFNNIILAVPIGIAIPLIFIFYVILHLKLKNLV